MATRQNTNARTFSLLSPEARGKGRNWGGSLNGRHRRFANVERGRNAGREFARAMSLEFASGNRAVQMAAEHVQNHMAALIRDAKEEGLSTKGLYAPRARTVARLLGAFYSGVKLKRDPIPIWTLSIRQWSKVTGLHRNTVLYLFHILSDRTFFRKQLKDCNEILEFRGLGWISQKETTEEMRVWFRDSKPWHGLRELSRQHDAVLRLRGASERSLSPAGCDALKLPLDIVTAKTLQLKGDKLPPPKPHPRSSDKKHSHSREAAQARVRREQERAKERQVAQSIGQGLIDDLKANFSSWADLSGFTSLHALKLSGVIEEVFEKKFILPARRQYNEAMGVKCPPSEIECSIWRDIHESLFFDAFLIEMNKQEPDTS